MGEALIIRRGSSGKRIAMGTVKTGSTSVKVYKGDGGIVSTTYTTATVTGLPFKPSRVLMERLSDDGTKHTSTFSIVYCTDADIGTSSDYARVVVLFKSVGSSSDSGDANGTPIRLKSPLEVVDGGFTLPAQKSATYEYIAFE